MPLLAEINTSQLFLCGLLGTAGFILFQTQRRMRQVGRQEKSAAKSSLSIKAGSHNAAPAELKNWQVDMHDFAREVSARIDSKLAALEHLTRAAHHECARLEAAIARAQQLDGMLPETPLADVEYVPTSQARALEEQAGQSPRMSTVPPPKQKPATDRPVREIRSLADAGLDLQAIAERVELPIGEVELILSLHGSGRPAR